MSKVFGDRANDPNAQEQERFRAQAENMVDELD